MIVVTGGAGFIGSNIIRKLNENGVNNIIVVDQLENGKKMFNLTDLDIADYLESADFYNYLNDGKFSNKIETIFHQGACSSTTEWNGEYLIKNNFETSKTVLHYSLANKAKLIYASSASVYGLGQYGFEVNRKCERPINMYAFSKLMFDNYVRKNTNCEDQIVGLRYFNVYGPYEAHKEGMASVFYHFYNQLVADNEVRLFEGTNDLSNGEQQRDFVHVDDVVAVNLFFNEQPIRRGIYNVGTGVAESFNRAADAMIETYGSGMKNYVPFPEKLIGSYQNYTKAEISSLREIGYQKEFKSLRVGVEDYTRWLRSQSEPN